MKMVKHLTLIITVILNISFGFSQSEKEKELELVEKETIKAINQWMENPQPFGNDTIDTRLFEQFQDSGLIVNGMKEGLWKEYTIDSADVGNKINVSVGEEDVTYTQGYTIYKEVGEYRNGLRIGKWSKKSSSLPNPYFFGKGIETEYKDGVKHGKEITFSLSDTIIVLSYFNGQLNGICKIFNTNYPHNLQKVFNVVDGVNWLIESYYPNGQLSIKYTDTIISGVNLKFFKEYLESGNLDLTGYYCNGEFRCGDWISYYDDGTVQQIEQYSNNELNGTFEYYHTNGQIWTQRIYKNGLPWTVISNFNRNGKKRPAGTLKNGSGTLKIYDRDDNLVRTEKYVEGIEEK